MKTNYFSNLKFYNKTIYNSQILAGQHEEDAKVAHSQPKTAFPAHWKHTTAASRAFYLLY